jgi:hypothetical protein
MGECIEFGKSSLDRSARAPHNPGYILHAAIPQLPCLHGRKAPLFFFGQGVIQIPHVLFDRRLPCLCKYKCHRWPPEKCPLPRADRRDTLLTKNTKRSDTNSSSNTYTTFDNFFSVAFCSAHSTPDLWPPTHPCFLSRGVGRVGAAPHTHQDQGPVTSRPQARRRPLASVMPQKTVGSLPCPIVSHSHMRWLPSGSGLHRAHGRGVARLNNP